MGKSGALLSKAEYPPDKKRRPNEAEGHNKTRQLALDKVERLESAKKQKCRNLEKKLVEE